MIDSFVSFFRFVVLAILFFQGLHAAPDLKKNPDKKVDILLKEVKDLGSDLKKFQDRLSVVIQQLEPLKKSPPSVADTGKDSTFFFMHSVGLLSQHLKIRIQEFFNGALEIFQAFWDPPVLRQPVGAYLLSAIISFCVALVCVLLGRFGLKRKIISFIHRRSHKPLSQLVFVTFLLVIVSLGYLGISVLTGAFIHRFVMALPYNWHLNYTTLLPFYLYIFWAGIYWIRLTCSPYRPSQAFIPMDPQGAYRVSYGLHTGLIFYLLTVLFLSASELLWIKPQAIYTVVDSFIVVISFFIFRALSVAHSHLLTTKESNKVLKAIQLIRIMIALGCGLWLIGRHFLSHFLFPLVSSTFLLFLIAPVDRVIQRYRIRILWRWRHRSFLLKPALISKTFLPRIAHCLIYGAVIFVWFPYLWVDHGFSFAWVLAITSSPFVGNLFNAFLIFISAVLLVKAGSRILKYYVEDKYATDSLENNFLASRLKTLMAMLKTALRIVVWVPAISLIFTQFGEINLTAWVASIGLAGFGFTVGIQSIVRDFVSGFFIILENNLMVGDEVEIDQRSGKVEIITLRTLRIRADNGVLFTIPFGSITVIGNKNRQFSALLLNISVGYREDLDKVQSLVEKAFSMVKRMPLLGRRIVGPLEVRGVTEVTSYSVVFQVKMKTLPQHHYAIRRAFTRQLKQIFDEAGIVVPISPHPVARAEPSLTNTLL